MKVRSKLILLAAGAIIIPILVAGITGLLSYQYAEKKRLITSSKLDGIVSSFQKEIARQDIGERSLKLSAKPPLPQGMDALVIDTRGNILFSSFSDIAEGPIADAKPLLKDMIHESTERHIMWVPLKVNGEARASLVLRFPPRHKGRKRPPFYVKIMEHGMYGFGALLVFSVVMVVVIMRSINRSITKLEQATRQVSQGSLDFELRAKGGDEFSSLTRSFEAMRLQLKEGREQRSRFLIGVSHDLKTPLTSIEGYLEAILDGLADNPDKLRKYITIVQEKSRLLRERIVQLIDYVKMETGEWKLKKEQFSLGEFLETIAQMFRDDAYVFKREFRYHFGLHRDIAVMGDRELLLRAFENLMTNAIQYTRENDTIVLKAYQEDNSIIISLTDTGPGIPPENIDKIFEPFFRGSASRKGRGTGLGLPVVKSIINTHGWSIEATSRSGEGTTFRIVVSKY
ncbi:MAG: HAMP domain-containing sensor histidine kinase [Spirochaetota bacterium]